MTQTQPPLSILDSLPKAELHLHLEGCIRAETAVELAARHGDTVTPEEVVARYSYTNFAGFIEAFKWVTSYLREPDDYALVTKRLAEELIRQNVVYAEITISVGVMIRRMQNVETNLIAIHDVAQSVPLSRLRIAWIFDTVRQFGPDAAMEVARWSAQLQKFGVVAFGMGGDELSLPTVSFRPAFNFARNEGLHLVCHAGEIGGAGLVREAVELLGAERIGHGIGVMHDLALADSLANRHVVLENCISSNLCTGALAKQLNLPNATLASHPLAIFVQRGILVTLSTDDPAMFHTDLVTEYGRAASLGLSNTQLLKLAEESFHAAFLSPIEKRKFLDDFRSAAKSQGLL